MRGIVIVMCAVLLSSAGAPGVGPLDSVIDPTYAPGFPFRPTIPSDWTPPPHPTDPPDPTLPPQPTATLSSPLATPAQMKTAPLSGAVNEMLIEAIVRRILRSSPRGI